MGTHRLPHEAGEASLCLMPKYLDKAFKDDKIEIIPNQFMRLIIVKKEAELNGERE
jgi:hypothetical protein